MSKIDPALMEYLRTFPIDIQAQILESDGEYKTENDLNIARSALESPFNEYH